MNQTPTQLIGNRTLTQSLRVEVHTAQILERVLIRKTQLESLLQEDLETSSRLCQIKNQMNQPGSMGLETTLAQRMADIERQRRDIDAQCWRDLNMVIPQLLAAVEGLQGAKAREDILLKPRPARPSTDASNDASNDASVSPTQVIKPHYTSGMHGGNYRA